MHKNEVQKLYKKTELIIKIKTNYIQKEEILLLYKYQRNVILSRK